MHLHAVHRILKAYLADAVRKAVVSVPFKQWVDNMEGPLGILNLGGSGRARCSLRQIMVQVSSTSISSGAVEDI